MREEAKIEIGEEFPAPDSEEMSFLLHSVVEQLLQQLPFPFVAGAVMEMSTKLLIDAGMIAVMEGKSTREELKANIFDVIGRAIDAWKPEHSNVISERKNLQ